MQRVLRSDCGSLPGKGEPGLIGAFCFDAAEGRHRGGNHDGIDADNRHKEGDETDEYDSPRHLSRAAPVAADRTAGRLAHRQGPRKWSTALARSPVFASVMLNVSGTEAAGGSGEYVLTRARTS